MTRADEQSTDLVSPDTATGAVTPDRHRYEYYYRPGMEPRPLPARAAPSPAWLPVRRFLAGQWVDHEIGLTPHETPMTRLLADHLWQGDELMDSVVLMFRRVGPAQGRQMLDQALDHGIDTVVDPPAELVALFDQLDNPPPWHDPAEWERGRITWRSSSLLAKFGMLAIDGAYTTMGDDVSTATGSTGWFAQNSMIRGRDSVAWFASLALPGSMDRFAEPFKNTVRVRLMHSQVRFGIRQSWDTDTFGRRADPISNSAMAGGLGAFGLSPLVIDRRLGRKISEQDLDEVTKFFAYILYIFGVSDEILAKNVRDAMANTEYIASLGGRGKTEYSAELNGAFHQLLSDLPRVLLGPRGGKLVELAVLPLFWGFFNYLVGEQLLQEVLRARPSGEMGATRLKIMTVLGTGAAAIGARTLGFLDRLPGATRRRERAAAQGDRALNVTLKLLAVALERHDAESRAAASIEPDFSGHDYTNSAANGTFATIS
ncbi:oxygenase MpaB family protein [Antrihabitans stalactiti]|uniref:DUF2236 domain-containing protein n=1 Tax=Antrihabitans stalactiti TaxID=2584121 RepID=A0A848KIK4_9NOCA|nr:oxygenase MpaB family protein [Antrihabitans stalactiti]NMN98903.1 DUF2236 domain-containing protein [Antrihabitans stalactiti]